MNRPNLLLFCKDYFSNYPDKIQYGPIVTVSKLEFYKIYLEYCLKNNIPFLSKHLFYIQMRALDLPIFTADENFRFIPSQVVEFIDKK